MARCVTVSSNRAYPHYVKNKHINHIFFYVVRSRQSSKFGLKAKTPLICFQQLRDGYKRLRFKLININSSLYKSWCQLSVAIMRNRFCLVNMFASSDVHSFSSRQGRLSLMILSWSRDRPSCGLPRLDKFHRVGVHVDSCRQLSAYGQTQKCSCQEMISVEYV